MDSEDQDEAFNTGLSLDLHGFTTATNSNNKDHHNHSLSCLKFDHVLPSLSLGLVDQAGLSTSPVGSSSQYSNNNNNNNNNNRSPNSMKASLAVAYGEEVEQLCSRASYEYHEEDEEPSPRKKLRLSKQQSAVLEDSFNLHSTLTPNQKEELAKQLNLRPRQVEVWFQNRRARTKLKQTEMECEMMRKCWEKLTEENDRLNKELTELKSLQVGSAVYMSMPAAAAATLSICPSCHTFISDAGDQGGRLVLN